MASDGALLPTPGCTMAGSGSQTSVSFGSFCAEALYLHTANNSINKMVFNWFMVWVMFMFIQFSCHPEVRRIYQLCMTDRKVVEQMLRTSA
jgi:hypothetical protein